MIGKGIVAGFVATLVLSALMLMKSAMGVMPAFNAIKDWVTILAGLGLPATPLIGWIAHLILGSVVWGALFAAVEPRLPGGAVASGTVFGVLAWLGMMVVFMPWAGNGLFALGIGPMAAVATLVLHIIYGAVLGAAFAKVTDANAMA